MTFYYWFLHRNDFGYDVDTSSQFLCNKTTKMIEHFISILFQKELVLYNYRAIFFATSSSGAVINAMECILACRLEFTISFGRLRDKMSRNRIVITTVRANRATKDQVGLQSTPENRIFLFIWILVPKKILVSSRRTKTKKCLLLRFLTG